VNEKFYSVYIVARILTLEHMLIRTRQYV